MRMLICAIRVAGISLIAGGLLLLQRRYPGVQPGRYLRSFYALYAGIIFIFGFHFGGKWRKMPGFPCRFLSSPHFKVIFMLNLSAPS